MLPLQPFVVESTKVIVTELPASSAVATPVVLVSVTAGYSSVTSGGQAMAGAVMSRTVIVCVQLEELLH